MNTYKVKRVIAFSNETTWEPGLVVEIEYSAFVKLMLDADALELVLDETKKEVPIELNETVKPELNKGKAKNVRNNE
jgi:hypothetical protein